MAEVGEGKGKVDPAKAGPARVDAAKVGAAKVVAAPDRFGRITAFVAIGLAVLAAVVVPLQLTLVAGTRVAAGLVAFFAALSLALGVRALVLRRHAPAALLPGLLAAVPASLGLVAAGVLAFHARGAALAGGPIGREHEAAMIAWEVGLAQGRARDLAVFGLASLPGFALALVALGLALGTRRAAKAATAPADAGTPAVSAHRKAIAAAWAALLGAAAIVAAGLAVDALAIAAPVDDVPHPRLADLAQVKDDLAHARVQEACSTLERVLAAGTPDELVDRELPGVGEIAHRCVGHGIERLPKGLACVEKAATLANGATARLVHAEDRVRSACDKALVGD